MSFTRLQLEFAAHLRDPASCPPPRGVEPRRMEVYRQLFFNNVSGLLATTFPVCRSILGEAGWARLVRRFYAAHKAQTPYFLELPGEFVQWLSDPGLPTQDAPPFLAELAHYEWVELALTVADADMPDADPAGDLLAGVPVLSPLAWPLAYRWPVHRLSSEFRPAEPPAEPIFVIVHRRAAGDVGFLQIDAASARLLQLVEEATAASGRELLEQVASEMPQADAAALVAQGERMLHDLRRRDVILGTRPTS